MMKHRYLLHNDVRKWKYSWIPVLDSDFVMYNIDQHWKLKALMHFEDELFPWEPTDERLIPPLGEIVTHHLKPWKLEHIGMGGPVNRWSLIKKCQTIGEKRRLAS